jgi:hypothetical protein
MAYISPAKAYVSPAKEGTAVHVHPVTMTVGHNQQQRHTSILYWAMTPPQQQVYPDIPCPDYH